MASKVHEKLIEQFGEGNKAFADALNKYGMEGVARMIGCSRQMIYLLSRSNVRSIWVPLKEPEVDDGTES